MIDILDYLSEEEKLQTSYINKDLWGEETLIDLRPNFGSAGRSAQKSGAMLEKVVGRIVYQFSEKHPGLITHSYHSWGQASHKPNFSCHYNLPRKGDGEIKTQSRNKIHIECKELWDVESHFDKLSHILLNVIEGCYGKIFWLVYNYNRSNGNNHKIDAMIKRHKEIQSQVRIRGIIFETIDVTDLDKHLNEKHLNDLNECL